MRTISTTILKALTKYFPILANTYVLISIILDKHSISISNYVFDIFGGSIYLGLICLMASFTFRFCTWHKIICVAIIIAYFIEWIDVNWYKIPNVVYVLQSIFLTSAISALLIHLYDKKFIRLQRRFKIHRRNGR